MMEVKFNLVTKFGFYNVDVRSTGCNMVVVAVNRSGKSALGYTPSQVNATARIHVNDIFYKRIATYAVA